MSHRQISAVLLRHTIRLLETNYDFEMIKELIESRDKAGVKDVPKSKEYRETLDIYKKLKTILMEGHKHNMWEGL